VNLAGADVLHLAGFQREDAVVADAHPAAVGHQDAGRLKAGFVPARRGLGGWQ
jgi:hypothetical protein